MEGADFARQGDQDEDLVLFAMAKKAVERLSLPLVARFVALMERNAKSEEDRRIVAGIKNEHPEKISAALLGYSNENRRLREIAPYNVFLTANEMNDISESVSRTLDERSQQSAYERRLEFINSMREDRLRRRETAWSSTIHEPKILQIPKTTPTRYISGIVALNIPRPEGTGDWHQTQIFFTPRATMPRTFIVERGQQNDPTRVLGDEGIYDASSALDALGVRHPVGPVFAADHARAIADLIIVSTLHGKAAEFVNLDGWMPRSEDKIRVAKLLEKSAGKLEAKQLYLLDLWRRKNIKVEEATYGRAR